jgi:hypothetical protein
MSVSGHTENASPKYRPCPKNGGVHEFERLKRNEFDKCIHCGEPRFALKAHKSDEEKSL